MTGLVRKSSTDSWIALSAVSSEAWAVTIRNLALGVERADLLDGVDAGAVGQVVVHQDDVELRLLDLSDGFRRARGLRGLVARDFQIVADALAHVRVVVDDQDLSVSCPPQTAVGNIELERRADAHGALHIDLPLMVVHHLAHDGQAEAGAARLRRKERRENLIKNILRNTAARVGDIDARPTGLGDRGPDGDDAPSARASPRCRCR